MSDTNTGAAPAAPEDTTTPVQTPAETGTVTTETGSDGEGQVEQTGDNDGNAEGDGATPKPAKPKKTAEERIQQLLARQREAQQRADDLAAENERLRAQQQNRTGQEPQPTASGDDAEPNPADYVYGDADAAYIADLATHRATRAMQREFEARQERQSAEAAQQTFTASRDAFAAKVTDENEGAIRLLTDRAAPVTREMAEIIFASDAGVLVADYLGDNYAEARRIASLPPHRQGVELGLLQARLGAPPIPPKITTGAPPPNPTARGTGGRFQVAPDTPSFSDFERQYTLE